MAYVCSICDREPTSHSFINIPQEGPILLFYSCPALAKKYRDREGIINHFDKTLEHYQCDRRPWKWIFDAHDFGFAHAMEIQTAIGLADLINQKYSHFLCAVHIVNPNWLVRISLNLVYPLLKERVQRIVRVLESPVDFKEDESGGLLSRVTSMDFSSHLDGVRNIL